MDLPTFVNIGIGLIFIYLILSLLVSEIQEMISSFLELRAKTLKEAITTLIGSEKAGEKSIINLLYEHSLISALNHQSFFGKIRGAENLGPSYIPAETFSTALIEILKIKDEDLNPEKFESAINKLGLSDNLRNNLIVLFLRAQINKTHFKDEVEKWFNRSMERAGGTYKRDAKVWAIFIGFLVAVFANADTLHIVSRLSKEKAINTSISSYVVKVQKECADKPPSCIIDKMDDESLTRLSLPIGWEPSDLQVKSIWHGLSKIIGWLLTSIATSMSASFWFDLLNKLINVRYSGNKPKEMSSKK
jgi:hypothetical protein